MARATSYSSGNNDRPGTITIEGTKSEIEALQAMLLGVAHATAVDGKIEQLPKFKPLPDLVDDPMVPPKWVDIVKVHPERRLGPRTDIPPSPGIRCPGYFLQGIGACNKEKYPAAARRLASLGFECLRSRRSPEGRFWEVWMLPNKLLADNALRDFFESLPKDMPWNEEADAAVTWMCRNLDFGSLDVTVQRAALVYD